MVFSMDFLLFLGFLDAIYLALPVYVARIKESQGRRTSVLQAIYWWIGMAPAVRIKCQTRRSASISKDLLE